VGEIRKIPQGFGGEIKVMLFFELEDVEFAMLRGCEVVFRNNKKLKGAKRFRGRIV